MTRFTQALQQKLAFFSENSAAQVEILSDFFTIQRGCVGDFLAEIRQSGELLSRQTGEQHAEYYAERLIKQVELLQQAVQKQQKSAKTQAVFSSSYRFPRNIHNLPPERRLVEYKKALRALNEKLAWLSEQCCLAEGEEKGRYIALLGETEYRKMKCLKAIEELE